MARCDLGPGAALPAGKTRCCAPRAGAVTGRTTRNPKAADAEARAQARTPFSRPRQKLYLGFPSLGKERQELRRVSERPFGQGAPPLILMLLLDRKQSSK